MTSNTVRLGSRPTRAAGLSKRAGIAAAVAAVAAIGLPATAAHAAEDVITVTNLSECNEPGSFGAALAQANSSTNADGVKIVFAANLSGTGNISFPNFTCKMWDTSIGVADVAAGDFGARYLIDAKVPVSVDFANVDGIETTTDADFAGIYVHSDNVVLQNLKQLRAGAAGVVIDGRNVTVRGFGFADASSNIAESGVALLNGATNVSISNSTFSSQYWNSIYIDSSTARPGTVSNVTIDNITSRGVDSGIGHVNIKDGAIVSGLTIKNSTFGADGETSTSHAMFINPNAQITGLTYQGNTVTQGAGAEANVFYFQGATANHTTFTKATIDGNTFQGTSRVKPLSRIVGDNGATWNDLKYTNNTATFTRGIRMSGTLNGALIEGNTFRETREPSDAGITLGQSSTNVTVSKNLLDTVWAVDGIRVEGTEARNVVIENNRIHDFFADVSRSGIALVAPGTNNVVRDNELVQDLTRANGTDLPTTLANHWAVYVWPQAGAATADATVGWRIADNDIDGYGGNPAIGSDAPITNDATGKTLITGNTFGVNTRGSLATETENLNRWFVWNKRANANHHVQTFRAERVSYSGTAATFTASQPAPLPGNTAAVAPVTLHVFWTAADNAEEYLGAIASVTPGQRVSIPTKHTSGYLRVQTVDANGNASQYSSVDTKIVVAPDAPAVTSTTDTTASGSGKPQSTIEVRDVAGKTVGTAVVNADGTWTVPGLTCATAYTAVQLVDGVASAATSFTTAKCAEVPGAPAAPTVTKVTKDVVAGTGVATGAVTIRDRDGKIVATGTVDAKGNWSIDISKLACGTQYTVTQTMAGSESTATTFRSVTCASGSLPQTGSADLTGVVGGAALFMVLGAGMLVAVRRKRANA